MRSATAAKLLPNDWLFGTFLLLTWARLVMAQGLLARNAVIFFSYIAVGAVLIYASVSRETDLLWRMRLLFYPIVMNLSYLQLRSIIPAIHPNLEDAFLREADRWFLGTNLSVRMQPFVHPAITEFMSLCYLLFLPCLAFSLIWYFLRDLELLKKFYVGLFSLYGIGLLGYTIVPALGPYLYMSRDFSVPLQGWWLTRWNSQITLMGSNHVDAFPSLHCAVSCYILFFDRTHKPGRFWLYLIPCVGLWISTIYLRYHYFVDLVFGFLLAGLSLWIATAFDRKRGERAFE